MANKLLLTSTGLANQNIKKEFLSMLKKNPADAKVLFIPTASRFEEELKYVALSKQELLDLGILESNIKTINLDKPVEYEEVKDFDVIYVCGGNTFYLLKKVQETRFGETIIKLAENGKLYMGVSAGSILAGPNIEIAAPGDENDVNLTDLEGLNLTKTIISPHYVDSEKQIIDDFMKKTKYPVVLLTDNQALQIINGEEKIIE